MCSDKHLCSSLGCQPMLDFSGEPPNLCNCDTDCVFFDDCCQDYTGTCDGSAQQSYNSSGINLEGFEVSLVVDSLTRIFSCAPFFLNSYFLATVTIGFVHVFHLWTFPEPWTLLSSVVIGSRFECVPTRPHLINMHPCGDIFCSFHCPCS